MPFSSGEIVSIDLNRFGELEVVRRFRSNTIFCGGGSFSPDRVVKQIYRADEGGMIRLAEEREGKHTPSRVVPESIEFS